jgi:nucleotide-binding universal stress UspA family protein
MAGFVVGYDGSDCAKAALTLAFELGDQFTQPVVAVFGFKANPVGGELTDYRKALEDHARGVLDQAAAAAQTQGVSVETVIAEEEPAHALADMGRMRDARAIIVGTRGESPWRGALVGSTPHKLLQLADRPVLVVPAPPSLDDA